MVGTPAWCALPDTDPAKLAALLDAARHWALRVDSCQQALCEASHDISAAADWHAISNTITAHRAARRSSAYIPRKDVA
jgi:hypothetical protein